MEKKINEEELLKIAFKKAAETGKPILFKTKVVNECIYAMPDGTTKIIHVVY